MTEKYSLRHGKKASDVKRRWMFNHPNTVVDRVQKIGISSDGEENYYHVFYHARVRESKKSKNIRRIRKQGGKVR